MCKFFERNFQKNLTLTYSLHNCLVISDIVKIKIAVNFCLELNNCEINLSLPDFGLCSYDFNV